MIPLYERFRNQPLYSPAPASADVKKKDVDADNWGDNDGPGAGGGYKPTDSFEFAPSIKSSDPADGVKDPKTPADDSDGPGAGGGYDDSDIDHTDSDGPGAGGGYDDSFTVSGVATAQSQSTWNLSDGEQVVTATYHNDAIPYLSGNIAVDWNDTFTTTTADLKGQAKTK